MNKSTADSSAEGDIDRRRAEREHPSLHRSGSRAVHLRSSGGKASSIGAKGDGISDDQEAIQRALDSGPGILDIPAGHYKIGRTLRIRGGTHLRLHPGATIRLADGAARTSGDYVLTNAFPDTGDADIVIEGGTWDGNNTGNPRSKGLFDGGYTGAMIHFQNVKGLRMENIRLHNAEAYYARFTEVRDFHVEAIGFSSGLVRNNNDGIHLGGHCENGVIRKIRGLHPGVTGDDMVALNADDALNRTEVCGMTCGPIRNIRIEDLEAEGCHSFVRMLSVWSPIEHVTVERVRGSCEVAALNCDAARGCRVPLFDEANPPFPDGVGALRNISLSDFQVAKSAENNIALLRLETRMENFVIHNFRRRIEEDKCPGQPTLRIRHVAARRLELHPGNLDGSMDYGDCVESFEPGILRLAINNPEVTEVPRENGRRSPGGLRMNEKRTPDK